MSHPDSCHMMSHMIRDMRSITRLDCGGQSPDFRPPHRHDIAPNFLPIAVVAQLQDYTILLKNEKQIAALKGASHASFYYGYG